MDGIGNVLQALLTVASTQLQIGASTQQRTLGGPQRGLTDELTSNGSRPVASLSQAWVLTNPPESALVPEEPMLGYNNNEGPLGLTWPVDVSPSQPTSIPPRIGRGDTYSFYPSRAFTFNSSQSTSPTETLGAGIATTSLGWDEPHSNNSQVLFELPANPVHGPNPEDPILARMAEQARRDEHGQKHAIEHFIQAAFFFYLKAREELETIPERVSKDAYLGLVKASWIVHDFLARLKDQGHTLPTNMEENIQVLSTGILRQFRTLKERPRALPDLTNLTSDDFKIFPDELKLVAAPHHPLPEDIEKVAILSRTESRAYRSRPLIPRKPVRTQSMPVPFGSPPREDFVPPRHSPDTSGTVELDGSAPIDQMTRGYRSPRNSTTSSVFASTMIPTQTTLPPLDIDYMPYGPRSSSTSTSSDFIGARYETTFPSRQNSNATVAPGNMPPPTPPESVEDDEQPGEQTAFKDM
jgi:hypothetical protein